MSNCSYKFLFFTSGSIAAYKGASLVSQLVKSGHQVKIIATENSLRFVGTATWEGLSNHAVMSDTFHSGDQMAHIHLRQWADRALVYPATANLINQLAAGLANDMVTTTLLAWDFKKPIWLAPAMNQHMYQHPACQASLDKLRHYGYELLPVSSGPLACGDYGEGRVIEPEQALPIITRAKRPSPLKILITSGGTEEAIDGVRSICNFSSGLTGSTIANALALAGHRVTLLRGQRSLRANTLVEEHKFANFVDLNAQLAHILGEEHFDLIIHAAAVSDYSLNTIMADGHEICPDIQGKLPSDLAEMQLHLKQNPKLIRVLRSYSSNPQIVIVGFKLTHGANERDQQKAIKKLFAASDVDLIVHNDLSQISLQDNLHVARFYSRQSEDPASHTASSQELTLSQLGSVQTREQLAQWLTHWADRLNISKGDALSTINEGASFI